MINNNFLITKLINIIGLFSLWIESIVYVFYRQNAVKQAPDERVSAAPVHNVRQSTFCTYKR